MKAKHRKTIAAIFAKPTKANIKFSDIEFIKGYFAKVNFDERDNIFWGKVVGINDSISFEGETVSQLTEDFHNAIDHYLADCKKEGRTPAKPYSGKLTLRISPDTHAEVAAAAAHTGKSLNKWVADTLDEIIHSH